MTENKESILEKIMPKNVKIKWTCNDHICCKTCVYYYFSCHGLNNSTDLRYNQIPEIEKTFITENWLHVAWNKRSYIYYLRFKEIGIRFSNLYQIKDLTIDKIAELIKNKV